MTRKLIGRNTSCDYVIFDPVNRVSREHAELISENGIYYLKDLNSSNGTFINGKRIPPDKLFKITTSDRITLSSNYVIDIGKVLEVDDSTKLLNQIGKAETTIVFNKNEATFRDGQKTIVFDSMKTQIGDISDVDNTPFVTIGRNADNRIVIANNNISRYHCKIRLLTPLMIEIEDLGSANGTFADDEKLIPNKKCKYSSSVQIRLGKDYSINLVKIFPNINIIKKADLSSNYLNESRASAHSKNQPSSNQNITISYSELAAFNDLEYIWKEYIGRLNQANNVVAGYSVGGAVIGLAAVIFTGVTGGVGGILLMSGGGIMGRYLGQKKSNEIRNDLTYEDVFLQVYSCPRCKESFQKKPWITIRECNKCKLKFR